MKTVPTWLPLTALTLATIVAAPTIATADIICPPSESSAIVTLAVPEVVELVLSTVLRKGVAVLLLSSTAIVSLPWLVAGVAATLFYIPRWLKASL